MVPTPCGTASASPNVGSGHNRRSAGAVLVRGAGPGLMHRLRLLVTARWWAGGGGLLLLLRALQTPHPSTPRRHGQPLRRGTQPAERVLVGAS